MITPRQYESQVAGYFRRLGYHATLTSYGNDYGLDVLAESSDERVAVQAKLYGHTSRQVNRQMIMELRGVQSYFDCDRAVLATDGVVRPDAIKVAEKLGVEILSLLPDSNLNESGQEATRNLNETVGVAAHVPRYTVDQIWSDYIMPLAGLTLSARGGRSNTILSVDWSGIERITSNGQKGRIGFEIFRLSISQLLRTGAITRDEINQNYAQRASSGVILVLSQVPFFRREDGPLRLVFDEVVAQARD